MDRVQDRIQKGLKGQKGQKKQKEQKGEDSRTEGLQSDLGSHRSPTFAPVAS